MIAVVIPVDTHAEERAAKELLANDAGVGEEAAVGREVAAKIGIPEAAEAVFTVGDEASERHIAAVVAQAAVRSVDAVVHPAGPVLVEVAETGHGAVGNSSGRRHRCLADLGGCHTGDPGDRRRHRRRCYTSALHDPGVFQ